MTTSVDALYCRVSTDMQREKGESIQNQKERLLDYAKTQNLNPHFYIDAGISAKDTNRPELQRLIRDIKSKKIGMVLVTKIDRITRNLKDLIELIMLFEDYGVKFKSLTQPIDTSSAMGRGQVSLMGVFAQMEREMTSERVGEDMRHRARNGKWNGGVVPYGYMVQKQQIRVGIEDGLKRDKAESRAKELCPEDKKLYVDEREAKLIKQIFDKYLEAESLRAVTHWLNKGKHPSRYGTTWAANSVSRVLRNPTYIGKLVYNKRVSAKTTGRLKHRPKDEWIISDGAHEPLVSTKIFNQVQAILKRQAVEPTRKTSDYLLSGLVKCGKCKGGMNGYTHSKPGKPSYSYYKCYSQQQKGTSVCSGSTANRKGLEDAVVKAIIDLCAGKQLVEIKRAHALYKTKITTNTKPAVAEKLKLTRRNEDIQNRKRVLLARLEEEVISVSDYKARFKELEEELAENTKTIYALESQLNDGNIDAISFDAVLEALSNFKKIWEVLEYQERKDLINTLVSKVVYNGKDKPVSLDLYFFENICLHTDTGSLRQSTKIEPDKLLEP